MELLKQLYKIHSPSGNERAMKMFIKKYVKRNLIGAIVESDRKGNMYITKGMGETYPCIVAHLDQVQHIHSADFVPVETEELIFGYSPRKRGQEGLGADDKNGIWIALKCLEKYDVMKVALFVEEEIGCIGSGNANMKFFENCRFVIQADRRGHKDLITSIGRTDLCSNDFLGAIGFEKFGYKETSGLMTDVLTLKEYGLGVSCINLSCGYYEPHTNNEFTVKKDLINCLNLIEHIIENCTDVYPHGKDLMRAYENEYMEAESLIFDALRIDDAMCLDDVIITFQNDFPNLTRFDFEQIYWDYFTTFPGKTDWYEEVI